MNRKQDTKFLKRKNQPFLRNCNLLMQPERLWSLFIWNVDRIILIDLIDDFCVLLLIIIRKFL